MKCDYTTDFDVNWVNSPPFWFKEESEMKGALLRLVKEMVGYCCHKNATLKYMKAWDDRDTLEESHDKSVHFTVPVTRELKSLPYEQEAPGTAFIAGLVSPGQLLLIL